MLKYQVIEAHNTSLLIEMVTKLMAQGFQPIGGVAVVAVDQNRRRFYQAMIKEPSKSQLRRKLIQARKKGFSLEGVFADYLDEMINDEDQG
jgi:hypothetical protein